VLTLSDYLDGPIAATLALPRDGEAAVSRVSIPTTLWAFRRTSRFRRATAGGDNPYEEIGADLWILVRK
jgi:hypothetical protein